MAKINILVLGDIAEGKYACNQAFIGCKAFCRDEFYELISKYLCGIEDRIYVYKEG